VELLPTPSPIDVPPTTIAIDTHILQYVQSASNAEVQALLNNGGHPILFADGSVHGSFCHSVAAARVLGLARVRVYVG
jgi:prepilin-type processing-associated H-X9-DG protein